jgi:hypothetical protein
VRKYWQYQTEIKSTEMELHRNILKMVKAVWVARFACLQNNLLVNLINEEYFN